MSNQIVKILIFFIKIIILIKNLYFNTIGSCQSDPFEMTHKHIFSSKLKMKDESFMIKNRSWSQSIIRSTQVCDNGSEYVTLIYLILLYTYMWKLW